MSRRIEIMKNISAELLNYLLVCSCVSIILADFAEITPQVQLLFIGAVVPLLFYAFRECCERLWLFLILHGIPWVVLIMFCHGSTILRVMLAGMLLFYTVLSIMRRIHAQERGMEAVAPPAAAGIYLALYLLDGVQGNGANSALLLQLMICFATGYFIYYYLRQFLSYVSINARTTENIPVKNVFYSSAVLMLVFSAVAFCLLTFGINRSLIENLSRAVGSLIRRLLSMIRLCPGEVSIEPEVTENPGWGGLPDLGEEAEASLFMQIMDVVLTAAAFAVIVFILGSGILALIRLLKEGFAKKDVQKKIKETELADRIEKIRKKEEKTEEKKLSLAKRWKQMTSPEEKIRRIYKKTILKAIPSWEGEKQEKLLHAATAREYCKEVFGEKEAEAREFAGLYEKARYGKALCGQPDVARMKVLAERLHGKR